MSISGLSADKFIFEGFLPKSAARQTYLKMFIDEKRTTIFFEAPHRLLACLKDMEFIFGKDRQIFIGRELTKQHEQHYFGRLIDIRIQAETEAYMSKGELVLVLSGNTSDQKIENMPWKSLLFDLLKEGLSVKKSAEIVDKCYVGTKNRAYQQALAWQQE